MVDRGDRRPPARQRKDQGYERCLIAVVLGAPSDSVRAQEALRLLNYGFTEYETVRLFRGAQVVARPEVLKGNRCGRCRSDRNATCS